MADPLDPFGALTTLDTAGGTVKYYDIGVLTRAGVADMGRLPYSVKILLENLLRRYDGEIVTQEDIVALAKWLPTTLVARELPFLPARVLLQDFTGIPVVADLAALRGEMARRGGDSMRVNPVSARTSRRLKTTPKSCKGRRPKHLQLNLPRNGREPTRIAGLPPDRGPIARRRPGPMGAGRAQCHRSICRARSHPWAAVRRQHTSPRHRSPLGHRSTRQRRWSGRLLHCIG